MTYGWAEKGTKKEGGSLLVLARDDLEIYRTRPTTAPTATPLPSVGGMRYSHTSSSLGVYE